MANDADWVADVRRWVIAGSNSIDASRVAVVASNTDDELGYEAAHPALQARHWPDSPRVGVSDPA
jgi:hypothetical protein